MISPFVESQDMHAEAFSTRPASSGCYNKRNSSDTIMNGIGCMGDDGSPRLAPRRRTVTMQRSRSSLAHSTFLPDALCITRRIGEETLLKSSPGGLTDIIVPSKEPLRAYRNDAFGFGGASPSYSRHTQQALGTAQPRPGEIGALRTRGPAQRQPEKLTPWRRRVRSSLPRPADLHCLMAGSASPGAAAAATAVPAQPVAIVKTVRTADGALKLLSLHASESSSLSDGPMLETVNGQIDSAASDDDNFAEHHLHQHPDAMHADA